MTKTMAIAPYFQRSKDEAADAYVAGIRGKGVGASVEVTLPADLVDRAVLIGARLSLILTLDGHFLLDSDQVACPSLEAACKAGGISKVTLAALVSECVRPELLDGEDEPLSDLGKLRSQLVRALTEVDEAMARLKRKRK